MRHIKFSEILRHNQITNISTCSIVNLTISVVNRGKHSAKKTEGKRDKYVDLLRELKW